MTDPLFDEQITVTALGALGDGVATAHDGQQLFVPGGLPGEAWVAEADGTYRRLTSHPQRAPDRCPHYGLCGGCATQHMPDDVYVAWKRDLVVTALRQHGFEEADALVAPLVRVAAQSRRRAVLTAVRRGAGFDVGFHAARSHDVIAIRQCAVLVPAILRVLPALGELAALTSGGSEEVRFAVLATATGLDVCVVEPRVALGPGPRARIGELAARSGFARVSIGDDAIVRLVEPALMVGDIAVVPPPGAFVQASAEAEGQMTASVLEGLGGARRVADLFAGLGTFTLPIARRASVVAFDTDKAALEALSAATRSARGLKPVTVRVRDLFREPLSPREFVDVDAVVFDPPRAGARAQAERLARTKLARIVAVSCNPATLARDLATLLIGPYRLRSVVPIDQFVFTAHVEAVAVLEASSQARPSRSRPT